MTSGLMRSVIPMPGSKALGRIDHLLRGRIRAMQGPSVDLDRVVIGLGAQKAGTSWLAWTLEQHPQVYSWRKEVHYWDNVRYPYVSWDRIDRVLVSQSTRKASPFGRNVDDHSRYLPCLEFGRTTENIVIDFTPSYALCTRSTFAEMKAVHRDVRFVFIIRDPVDRLWSGVRHKMRAVLERDPGFGGLERMVLEACENPHDPDFRRSCYEDTIEALEAAGCDVHIAFYETLFAQETVSGIARFIGLDGVEAHSEVKRNTGAGGGLRLSEETRAVARKALAGTYDYVFERFGDGVPAKWRR